MNQNKVPYEIILFCCTNRRENSEKPSCGVRGGEVLREALKTQMAERGLRGRVRVSQSGCLGQCAHGPNIMVFPEGTWYSGVTEEDVPHILDAVEQAAQAN
jgi:(2Fe-2S) ferredoxin